MLFVNIVDLDLNLLRTFHAVHAERSVSRAAERLGLSQPTVSHALARLRRLYRDPLFVRVHNGVAPTARADRLAEAVRAALATLDAALQEGDRYDPAASARTFRIYMSDIGEMLFLPRLLQALAAQAPKLRLETYQLDEPDILPALESGRIDLAVGYIPVLAGVEKEVLRQEHYVVVMRAGHPHARRAPTRAALRALDYVVVRSHPASTRVLQGLGVAERVRLEIPHFLVLPRILAATDLATLVPERLAAEFATMGEYAAWHLRLGLPAFAVSVHWYWRYAGDPGNRWLRELIVALFREAPRAADAGRTGAPRQASGATTKPAGPSPRR
jgi:DNA-binding transcriptional LysR family regulator